MSKKSFSRWITYISLLTIAGAFFAWLGSFCLSKTKGFALYKIRSTRTFDAAWDTFPLSHEENATLKQALSQPYYFLDKGAQCYVFLSEDGRYVIKFFKLHALSPPIWLDLLQLPMNLSPLRIQKILEKRQSLHKTFTSYKIANEEMKEETGILFLHLNKTQCLHQKLTIFDNLKIAHSLNLDEMEFLVQKRASLFYPFLEKTIRDKGIDSVKPILSDLVHFLVERNRKEIFDKDPDLATNFGVLENKLIQIDVGRFRKDAHRKDPTVYHDEILRITDQFNQWLKMKYPSLSSHLEQEISSIIPHETSL